MGESARRWGRRALGLAALTISLYYLLLGGEYDALDVRQLRGSRTEAAARVDALQSAVDSLAAAAERLTRDSLAIERIARQRYGFVRDGERLFRFVGSGADRTEPAARRGVVRP